MAREYKAAYSYWRSFTLALRNVRPPVNTTGLKPNTAKGMWHDHKPYVGKQWRASTCILIPPHIKTEIISSWPTAYDVVEGDRAFRWTRLHELARCLLSALFTTGTIFWTILRSGLLLSAQSVPLIWIETITRLQGNNRTKGNGPATQTTDSVIKLRIIKRLFFLRTILRSSIWFSFSYILGEKISLWLSTSLRR